MDGGRRGLIGTQAIAAIAALGLIGCGDDASATSPQQVAGQLTGTDTALRQAIDEWRAPVDPPSSPPPEEVSARATDLQDQVRFLARHPNLTAEVIPLLSGSVAAEIRRLVAASRALIRLSAGTPPKKFKVGAPPPLADLLSHYGEARRRVGIDQNYLAAIHFVETKFGRVKSNSVAGAQGPMQFIPSTWEIYGHGGEIRDPHDAILAAARLLRANGAPGRYGGALYAYNPSRLYVAAVTQYAKLIARDPYALYLLYCWEP
jgi:soluble lytic murein transglycosylase-like protein